jgi:hypothetical protein
MALAIAIAVLSITPKADAAAVNITRSTPGWTYFNRPGANASTHDSELQSCLQIASTVPPLFGSLAGGIVGTFIDGSREATRLRSNAENCMVVRGWNVVRVPDNEGAALAALSREKLSEKLSAWVGAEHPHGEIARRWDNDVIKRETIRGAMPALSRNSSLSLTSLAPSPTDSQTSTQSETVKGLKAKEIKTLTVTPFPLTQIDKISPESAIVVVTLRGPVGKARGVYFRRFYEKSGATILDDGKPSMFWIMETKSNKEKQLNPEETTLFFAIPPGKWGFDGFTAQDWGENVYSACLGFPYFEASAGEILYTGAFDLNTPTLTLDTSLDSSKILPSTALTIGRKIRIAEWMNGAKSNCAGYIYDLEFPGMPYAPDYTWGGVSWRDRK